MSNDKALVFAQAYAQLETDVTHIYDDGIVIGLKKDTITHQEYDYADRHLAIRETLIEWELPFQEACVNGNSAFVIPCQLDANSKLLDLLKLITRGYRDHRKEDYHMIELAYKLFQRIQDNERKVS